MASTVLGNPPCSASSLRSSTSASRPSTSTTKMPETAPVAMARLNCGSCRHHCLIDVQIRGGVLKAVRRRRPLVLRPARKHRHPFLSERHSGADHGVISPRDYIIHVVSRRWLLHWRFLLRQLDVVLVDGSDAVDRFAAHLCLGRVELDLVSRPVLSVLAANLGAGIPIRHIERQSLLRSAEIKNNFVLFLSIRSFSVSRAVRARSLR